MMGYVSLGQYYGNIHADPLKKERQTLEFIHFIVKAGPESIIQVNITQPAYVRLMDEVNFQKYKMKKRYTFTGGYASTPKVDLRPNQRAEWHVVVDLEGLDGEVRASLDLLRS